MNYNYKFQGLIAMKRLYEEEPDIDDETEQAGPSGSSG